MTRPMDRDGDLYRRMLDLVRSVAANALEVSMSCCTPGPDLLFPCGEKWCTRCRARQLLRDLGEGA